MIMQCINKFKKYVLGMTHLPPKCGRCHACRVNKSWEWMFRLYWENKQHDNAYFITLTYDNDHLPIMGSEKCKAVMTLNPDDTHAFMHRLRKFCHRNKDSYMRYWLIGEYGKKYKRPHYHLILWGPQITENEISKLWGQGIVHIGQVTESSINYCSGYTWKRQDEHVRKTGCKPEFIRMSKGHPKSKDAKCRSGLGTNYLNHNAIIHIDQETDSVSLNGFTIKMPQYFKNLLWNQYSQKLKHCVATGDLGDQISLSNLIEKSFLEDQIKSRIRTKSEKQQFEKYQKTLEQITGKSFEELTLKELIDAEKKFYEYRNQSVSTSKKKSKLKQNTLD